MKLKNKLILIISLGLSFVILMDIVFGESYFVSFFRYSKAKNLEQIDFVNEDGINYKKLSQYQKSKNAFVIILKDDKILNMENFDYLKMNTKSGEKYILLNAFLDNLYSEHKFHLQKGDKVAINGIQVLKNYYIPSSIINGDKEFKDYKFNKTKIKKYKFKGDITRIGMAKFNLSQGDDLLEALLGLKISEEQNRNYKETDGDDEFQLISKKIDDYHIIIFYSYEDINDIFPTLKLYFYIKGIILILISLIIGKILEKIIINPVEKLSKITNDISNLNFTWDIEINSHDEIGQLYKDIANMSNKLENIIELYKEESKSNKNLNIKLEENIKYFMHEIKTPLSVIIGFSDLLLLENSGDELGIINKEGKRLLRLSNELIMNNTLKTNELVLKKKAFNLIYLIELANKICEVENIKININLEGVNPPIVYGDPEKIEQVILNLIKNAIEHTKDEINIYLESEKDLVYFIIENNGPLIKDKDLSSLWNKFYTTNEKGRGLGLYICATILTAHKSKFGVKNIEDGVQFYFTLKTYVK